MSEQTDTHPTGERQTQSGGATNSDESDGSTVSRRNVLRSAGAGAGATFLPTSGITGMIGSGFGLNNKGTPVIVSQRTRDNPLTLEQRRQTKLRVFEEAADRGRQPPEKLFMSHKPDVPDSSYDTGDATEDLVSDGETVVQMTTITDDGMPRTYLGRARTRKTTGRVHGQAMGRAKQLAKKNNSEIELHKPDGTVETTPASDVGKARRATDISGTTDGFIDGLVGTEQALIDKKYHEYVTKLESSLSTALAATTEVENIDEMETKTIYGERAPYGQAQTEYTLLYEDTGLSNDLYGVESELVMRPGIAIDDPAFDGGYKNNTARMRHYNWQKTYADGVWRSMDLEPAGDEHFDWAPKGTTGGSSYEEHSVFVEATSTLSGPEVSGGYENSWGEYNPGRQIVDTTDFGGELGIWEMDVYTDSIKESNASFTCSSVCEKPASDCSIQWGSDIFSQTKPVYYWDNGGSTMYGFSQAMDHQVTEWC